MYGIISLSVNELPMLRDEAKIVAGWYMDARTLDWLIDSLDGDDEVTKSLVRLREEAKDYAWGH